MHVTANLRHALALILLELLLRAHQLHPAVYLVVETLLNLRLRHFYRVDGGLMQEQFLHSQLFWQRAVGVSLQRDALCLCLQTHRLHVRLQDRFVADHPDHLVDDARLGNHGCGAFHLCRILGHSHACRHAAGTDAGHSQRHCCCCTQDDVSTLHHSELSY